MSEMALVLTDRFPPFVFVVADDCFRLRNCLLQSECLEGECCRMSAWETEMAVCDRLARAGDGVYLLVISINNNIAVAAAATTTIIIVIIVIIIIIIIIIIIMMFGRVYNKIQQQQQ